MPYAVVRSQFAENLQVTAPYGTGWSLLAWWPFSPSRICSSVQMPACCCFLQKLLHVLLVRGDVSSSFAEAQPRRDKKNKKTLPLYAHSSTAVLSLRSETSEVSEQHHSLLEVLCHKQKRNDKFSSGYPLLTECAVAVLATDQCC